MATTYIYEYIPHYPNNDYVRYFATTNDVTLLSNADGYTDRGQFQYDDTWRTGWYSSAAIDLLGNDARLSIGGNFTNSGEYYTGDRANVYYKGNNIRDDAAAIRFHNNGFLFLTADTGAGTAHDYNDESDRDKNIRIVGIADTYRNRERYTDENVPPVTNNTTISAIEAGDKLTIGGDLSGEIIAEATSFLHGISRLVSNVWTPTNITVGQTNVANGIKTGGLVIRNNQKAIISATANADIKVYVRPAITGSTLSAIGIEAARTVICANGQWAGEITTINNNNILDALWNDDEGNVAIVGIGTADPITHPGVMTGNKLSSIGVNAGSTGSIEIAEMIESNGTRGHNVFSKSNNNTLKVSAIAAPDTAVTLTFTDNTIDTYAINGSTVKIDTVDAAVVLKTESNDNEFFGKIDGGKTPTIILSNNHIETIGIKADNFTTTDFQGQISAIANDNKSSFSGGGLKPTPSGNYLSTNGIRVSDTLTAGNNFGGTITVEANNNNMGSFQYCEVYGVNAKNFTVTGRIDTDISVTARNNSFVNFSAVGIGVTNDLTADAFSGTIISTSITTCTGGNRNGIGISVQGKLTTTNVDDAFDINGTIKADGFGVLSRGKLNLRVSGTIESGYNAIWAESYWQSTSSKIMVNPSLTNNDQVELAHTANITGDIDLELGENKLVINSGANMNGRLLASGGKMNIQFVLDGSAKADAIVKTDIEDVSLTSVATISINLDYAKEGDTYTLFDYKNNNYHDYSQYWTNKQVTIVYRGKNKIIKLENGVGTTTFKDDDDVTIASVEVKYVNGQVKVEVTDVTAVAAFDADAIFSSYDVKNRKLILKGFSDFDTIYEVEYTVYDANGIAYGNSIVLRVDAFTTDRAVISGINSGDQVRWRIRANVQNSEEITNWSEVNETTISNLHHSADSNLTPLPNQVSDAKLLKIATGFDPDNGLTLTLPKAAVFQVKYSINGNVESYYVDTASDQYIIAAAAGDKVKWSISIMPEGMDYAEWQASSDRVWTTPVITDTLLTEPQDESVDFGSILSFTSAYDKVAKAFTISADDEFMEGLFFKLNYRVYDSEGDFRFDGSACVNNKNASYTITESRVYDFETSEYIWIGVNPGDKVAWSVNVSPDEFTWEGWREYGVSDTVQYTEEAYVKVINPNETKDTNANGAPADPVADLFGIVTEYENKVLTLSRDSEFIVNYSIYAPMGNGPRSSIGSASGIAATLDPVSGKYVVTIDNLDADYRVDWSIDDLGDDVWSELVSTDIVGLRKIATKYESGELKLSQDEAFSVKYAIYDETGEPVTDAEGFVEYTEVDAALDIVSGKFVATIPDLGANYRVDWRISDGDNGDWSALVSTDIEKTITVDVIESALFTTNFVAHNGVGGKNWVNLVISFESLPSGTVLYYEIVDEDGEIIDHPGSKVEIGISGETEYEIERLNPAHHVRWKISGPEVNDNQFTTTFAKSSKESEMVIYDGGGDKQTSVSSIITYEKESLTLTLTSAQNTVKTIYYSINSGVQKSVSSSDGIFNIAGLAFDDTVVWEASDGDSHHNPPGDARQNTTEIKISGEVMVAIDETELPINPKFDQKSKELVLTFTSGAILNNYLFKNGEKILIEGTDFNVVGTVVTFNNVRLADIISIANKPAGWDTMSPSAKDKIFVSNIWSEIFETIATSDSFVTHRSSIIVESVFARDGAGLKLTLTPVGDALHHQYFQIRYKIAGGVDLFTELDRDVNDITGLALGDKINWQIRTSSDGKVWEKWSDDQDIIASDGNNTETSEIYITASETVEALVKAFTSEYDPKNEKLLLTPDLDKLPIELPGEGDFHIKYSVIAVGGQIKKDSATADKVGDDYVFTGVGLGDIVKWHIIMDDDNQLMSNEVITQIDSVMMSRETPIALNPDDFGAGNTSAVSKFTWGRAISDNAIVRYRIEYFESEIEIKGDTQEEIDALIKANFANPSVKKFGKYVTSTEAIASGLTDQAYVYWRVQAIDTEGNASAWQTGEDFRVYVGDDEKPVFISGEGNPAAELDVTYDHSNSQKIKVDVTFTWNPAVDQMSGVKRYLVEYKLVGQDWDEAKRIHVRDDKREGVYSETVTGLAAGIYEYRISAVDYVGNQSAPAIGTTGFFGKAGLTPPTGTFENLNAPLVSAVWNEVENKDAEGNVISITRTLVSAKVDFSWNDTYVDDEGMRYKIQFSDSSEFDNPDKTYVFQTHSEDKSYSIGNWLPTQPVGIFAEMDTVYWRVMASNTYGNDTGHWSSEYGEFKFIDPATGILIKHEAKPEAAYNLTVKKTQADYLYNNLVNYQWSVINSDLGIDYFVITFTRTDTEGNKYTFTRKGDYDDVAPDDSSATGGISNISRTEQFKDDGYYSWTVTTYNTKGQWTINQVTKGKPNEFVVDSVRPTTVLLEAGETIVHVSDVYLTWKASRDDFGIERYEIQYRLKGSDGGWEQPIKITDPQVKVIDGVRVIEKTINTINTSGEYEYIIYAYDKSGNRSLVSETRTFTINKENDLADERALAKIYSEITVDDGTGTGNKIIKNTIGASDKDDYFYFDAASAGETTLSVTGLDNVFNRGTTGKGIVISIYGPGNNNTGVNLVQSYRVTGDTDIKIVLDQSGPGQHYYVRITAANSKEVLEYELKHEHALFPTNNADDKWVGLTGYNLEIGTDGTGKLVDKAGNDGDWVGYGDAEDYRKLDLTHSGLYNFTISGQDVGGNLENTVRMTIYEDVNGKLKRLKTITVKANSGDGSIKDLLLDDRNSYYLQVEAPGHAKGDNSGYKVDITGETFKHVGINNFDNEWKGLNLDDYTLEIAFDGSGLLDNEWVGYGDPTDYRKLDLTHSGSYSFSISGASDGNLENAVRLTIHEDVNGKLKRLKSITVKPRYDKFGNFISNGNGSIDDLLLNSNSTYYLQVDAPGYKKAQNAEYEVVIGGTPFGDAVNSFGNNEDDNWKTLTDYDIVVDDGAKYKLTVDTAGDGLLDNEWVGFGDAEDYRLFDLAHSGSYNFSISGASGGNLENAVRMTIYEDVNGKLKRLKSITVKSGTGSIDDLLLYGNHGNAYYLQVEATGYKKAQNAAYEIDITGEVYDTNNADDNWGDGGVQTLVADDSTISDWVGFDDAKDWFNIDIATDGKYQFNLDLDTARYAKMKLYNVDGLNLGKAIKLDSDSAALLVAGNYALEISSADAGRGQKNTGYQLWFCS